MPVPAGDTVERVRGEGIEAFVRGDCRNDGKLDISDAIFVLAHLFLGEDRPGCLSACDSNDDSRLDLSDAVALLSYLFLGGDALPLPRGACGADPSPDELGCEEYLC
jgi:hypothetical protein